MTTPLHDPKLYHIRDLFLFSCYTGIPYGDMCRLTTEDLEVAEDGEVWIKTARKKTKIDYEVPLLDIPLLILDKYRICPGRKTAADVQQQRTQPDTETYCRHLRN